MIATSLRQFCLRLGKWLTSCVNHLTEIIGKNSDSPTLVRQKICEHWLSLIQAQESQQHSSQTLAILTTHVEQNIAALLADHAIASKKICRLMLTWGQRVYLMLARPDRDHNAEDLLAFLVSDNWPLPMGAHTLEELIHAMGNELELLSLEETTQIALVKDAAKAAEIKHADVALETAAVEGAVEDQAFDSEESNGQAGDSVHIDGSGVAEPDERTEDSTGIDSSDATEEPAAVIETDRDADDTNDKSAVTVEYVQNTDGGVVDESVETVEDGHDADASATADKSVETVENVRDTDACDVADEPAAVIEGGFDASDTDDESAVIVEYVQSADGGGGDESVETVEDVRNADASDMADEPTESVEDVRDANASDMADESTEGVKDVHATDDEPAAIFEYVRDIDAAAAAAVTVMDLVSNIDPAVSTSEAVEVFEGTSVDAGETGNSSEVEKPSLVTDAASTDDSNRQLIHALKEEVKLANDDVCCAVEILSMPGANEALFIGIQDSWESLNELTMQLAVAMRFDELEACCTLFSERLQSITVTDMASAMIWAHKLDAWGMMFHGCMEQMDGSEQCDVTALLACLCDEDFWQSEVEVESSPSVSKNLAADGDAAHSSNQELINALREEISLALGGVGSGVGMLSTPDASVGLFSGIQRSWESINELAMQLAIAMQLDELEACCALFSERLQAILTTNKASAIAWTQKLDAWGMMFHHCMEQMDDAEACDTTALLELLCDEDFWQNEVDVESPPAANTASEADLSLRPSEAVHPEVMHEFLIEAEEHAATFSALIQQIYHAQADQDTLSTAQRIAHTLKGAARATGYTGLANICLYTEELMEYLVDHQLEMPTELLTIFMEAADCIEVMVEHVQGSAPAPADSIEILQQLMDWHFRLLHASADVAAASVTDDADVLPSEEAASKEAAEEQSESGGDALDAFKQEIILLCDEIGSVAEMLKLPDADASLLFHVRDAWQELNDITLQMAQMLKIEPLESCCLGLAERVAAIGAESMDVAMQWAERLDAWMLLFRASMDELHDPAAFDGSLMLEYICDEPSWIVNVSEEACGGAIESVGGESAVPPEQATEADVTLTPGDDLHADVLHEFLIEAEDHATTFSASMQSIYAGHHDQETLATAQRIAHTLKGAANTTGFRGIANITHHAEDLLEYLYQHKLTPPQALMAMFLDVGDCLEMMVEHIQGRGDAPADAVEVLQQLMNWHALMRSGGLRISGQGSVVRDQDSGIRDQEVEAEERIVEKEVVAEVATANTQVVVESLRVPTRLVDDLMRDVGEITILMGQVRNRFSHLIDQAHELSRQEFIAYQNGIDLDVLMSARGMALVRGVHDHSVERSDDIQAGFDPLEMDQYNELHSGLSRLLESVSDSRTMAGSMQSGLEEMDALLLQHQRLHSDLQDNIMQTRMMPFANLEMRLQRVVRQTSRKTEKEAELLCSGMELMMDTDVLNKLVDPLMHILRNAVDHGIEPPDERVKRGKPSVGTVRLEVSHFGSDILIRCSDDGQGLDYDAIRSAAAKKGMIGEGQDLSNDDLARMTLLPGFTTRKEVTQVSGRGFGMDIVFQAITQVKGRVIISTGEYGGLVVTMHLPVTLMTIHSILVECEQQRYAIPSRDVLRVLNIGDGVLQGVGQSNAFAFEGRVYPLHSLDGLLWGHNEEVNLEFLQTHIPLIVRADEGEHVVLIERIHACHELIMKSMGRYVPHIHGIAGASILDDSSVASVLDLAEMLRESKSGTARRSKKLASEENDYVEFKARETTVMIVDDSLSVRRTLSRLMQDEGYRTILAIDGVEAISKLEEETPDIMLLDMELPRMNGLELAAYLRRQESTVDLPIIMITSRATRKHRERAEQAGVNHYIIKPYQEDDLLEQIERLLGKSS